MSVSTQTRRKRTRTNNSNMDGVNDTGADSLLEGMLARQSSFLQHNLKE